MSLGMDEFLGGAGGADSNLVIFATPTVHMRTASSYFPESGDASTAGSGFNMEETLEFNDLAVPISFHDLLGLEPAPAFTSSSTSSVAASSFSVSSFGAPSIDTDTAFKRKSTDAQSPPSSSSSLCQRLDTPSSSVADDEFDLGEANPGWERELEKLISEFDGQVPIDEKLKDELISAAVKDFNRRTKAMKLDGKTIQYLKLQRKRGKNRLAAIRSRSRKDTQVIDLQQQVDLLVGENKAQKDTISRLQFRLEAMEKELRMSRRL